MTAVLFIDANQYVRLYGLLSRKKLLDPLEELREHIFVSTQIAHEVQQNKLHSAQVYLEDQLKKIGEVKTSVPDHLLGIKDEKTRELREALGKSKLARDELEQLTGDALLRISNSEDDTSNRLALLFKNAVAPKEGEIQRARKRKELGRKPGKPKDSLGDQIIWEQLLSHCKQNKVTKVWIVTDDRDFCEVYQARVFLNPSLRDDLIEACGEKVEIYCFNDLAEGITDFGKNSGLTADKLPTDKEAAEIKRELEALPPVGWMQGMSDDHWMAAARNAWHRRRLVAAMPFASNLWLNFAPDEFVVVQGASPTSSAPTNDVDATPKKADD
jgi:hypothetical protein